MYNTYPVFWPFKAYWFMRKTFQLFLIKDFPEVPENHPDRLISRGYFPMPSFMKH